MTETNMPATVSLGYYTRVLRRGWLWLVSGALLGILAALTTLQLLPPQATATALVSLNVITSDPFSSSRPANALIDVPAEAQVASSTAVAQRASAILSDQGSDVSAQDIRSSVEATPVASTTLLRISSTQRSQDDARAIADAVATAYIDFRGEQASARIDRTLEASLRRLDPLQEELSQLNRTITNADAVSVERAQAEAERALVSSEISALFATTAELRAIDTTAGVVLDKAAETPIQWAPRPAFILGSGLIVGLGLGIIVAFLANALRPRVRDARDVPASNGSPVLGTLPSRQVTIPASQEDERQLRAVREQIWARLASSSHVGVLGVTDAEDGAHATELGLNLAWLLAGTGARVEYVAVHGWPPEGQAVSFGSLGLQRPQGEGARRWTSSTRPTFSIHMPEDRAAQSGEPIGPGLRSEIARGRDEKLIVLPITGQTGQDGRFAGYGIADVAIVVAERAVTRPGALYTTCSDLREFDVEVLGTVLVHRARQARRELPVDFEERHAAKTHPDSAPTSDRRYDGMHRQL